MPTSPRHADRRDRRPGRGLRTLMAAGLMGGAVGLSASPARAQDDEPLETPDARYEGYAGNSVVLPDSSTAVSYLLLGGLGVLAAGVMFKDAKRSHLD